MIGLLDDDSVKHGASIGASIAAAPVQGTITDVARPEIRRNTTNVILAMQSATRAQHGLTLELVAVAALATLTVPTAENGRDARTFAERLRDIEPGHRLGREPVQLGEAGIGETLRGKTVLITGAGGSIGT